MTNGIIYILTNASMPGLVKVGKTKEDSNSRAAKLSSATGVPTKFEVYKEYAVTDPDEAERFAHTILERVLGRPSSSREFFTGEPADVASLLDDALSTRLIKKDEYAISDFESPLSRLSKKEFSLACIEFENIFKELQVTDAMICASSILQMAAGAYLACCYAKNERPMFSSILAPSIKGLITERAIKFAEAFESDPTHSIIQYVRSLDAVSSEQSGGTSDAVSGYLLGLSIYLETKLPGYEEPIDEKEAERLRTKLIEIARIGYHPALHSIAEIFMRNFRNSILFRQYYQDYLIACMDYLNNGYDFRKDAKYEIGKSVGEYVECLIGMNILMDTDLAFVQKFLISGDQFIYGGFVDFVNRFFHGDIKDRCLNL